MVFTDLNHQQRFDALRRDLAPKYLNDREHLAVIYLLSGNDELCNKVDPYYDGQEGTFKYDKLIKEQDLTFSARVLVDLAYSLYKGDGECKVTDLGGFGNETLKLALRAIELRFATRRLYEAGDQNSYIK